MDETMEKIANRCHLWKKIWESIDFHIKILKGIKINLIIGAKLQIINKSFFYNRLIFQTKLNLTICSIKSTKNKPLNSYNGQCLYNAQITKNRANLFRFYL